MPGSSWISVDVKCEYHLYDDGKSKVVCEGYLSDSNQMWFKQKDSFIEYMRRFCCSRPEDCPHYQRVNSKYVGEDGEYL